jgi:ubiquinone/menaquinone biosynthesis C-methylase UbiE
MEQTKEKNPWDYLHPHDVARFGDVINDQNERTRWCGAILTGGLPYMWREARAIRELVYMKLDLKAGDRVLLIGESNESGGFDSDIREHIGPKGELKSIDIIERARDMCFRGLRGKNGKLGTWQYDYTRDVPDNYYDAVVLMQGVQHCEDWTIGAKELLRVLKPSRAIVLAEIAHGPYLIEKARIDVHLEYYVRKLYMGTNQRPEDFSYWSIPEIESAFSGRVKDSGHFAERGFEIFWGRKPP